MPNFMKTYALMRGHRIYTLQPLRGPEWKGTPWKWIGYIDGQRWRMFPSKKAFEEAVSLEPLEPRGPNADAVERAVMYSEIEGRQALRKLAEGRDRRVDPT